MHFVAITKGLKCKICIVSFETGKKKKKKKRRRKNHIAALSHEKLGLRQEESDCPNRDLATTGSDYTC